MESKLLGEFKDYIRPLDRRPCHIDVVRTRETFEDLELSVLRLITRSNGCTDRDLCGRMAALPRDGAGTSNSEGEVVELKA